MPKYFLIIVLSLFFIVALLALDETITAKAYDDTLQKIEASGILIDKSSTQEHFFGIKHHLVLTLENSLLLNNLLFDAPQNSAFAALLAQLQGVQIEINLSRKKYLAQSAYDVQVKPLNLPTTFQDGTLLFESILAYLQTPLHGTIDFNHHTFSLDIDYLSHTFEADQNISYRLDIQHTMVEASFETIDDFTLRLKLQKTDASLLEQNLTRASTTFEDLDLSYTKAPDHTIVTLSMAESNVTMQIAQPLSLHLQSLDATQKITHEESTTLHSKLSLEGFGMESHQDSFWLKGLHYDIDIENLPSKPLEDLHYLVSQINNDNLLYIFEEIDADVQRLLAHPITLTIRQLEAQEIRFNTVDYGSFGLELALAVRPNSPPHFMTLQSTLRLDPILFAQTQEHLTNANLFVPLAQKNREGVASFELTLLKDGWLINEIFVAFDSNDSEVAQESNISVEEVENHLIEEEFTPAADETVD